MLSSPEYATSIGLIIYSLNEEHTLKKARSPFAGFSWLKDIFE